MPPSPGMRFSPGRELLADNINRRRSLEYGTISREGDENLALFNEVQNRERDNFLFQPNDEFEDSFSTKLRYFSDYNLGINIPARGESSDLLNADEDKNDYDWLITPPDTPLFHSLDEDSTQVNVAQRGRTRTQTISIPRSPTMEKSHRSSRGSPNRLSPSPRSGNSTFQSRGRTSPAPGSSPTPTIRPATPTHTPTPARRPSSPSSKSTTPATPKRSSTPAIPIRRPSSPSSKSSPRVPRASTLTPPRVSTSSTARGTSPVKTGRGSSTSPKVRAWESNIPGFSSEAPPNLRTSLADRPASYVRGSSPASSANYRRQSMSPTASRSVSPYHSQDRDIFSSHSKGSMASSGDDDVESLPPVILGSSDRLASRRVGGEFPNNRASPVSKKPSKAISSSSAPKKSFDLALRQMDQRKSPSNMFRPLLSSVPSTTFHAGKGSAAHRLMTSRNSSITTSSNASSDLGTSGVHEASDQNEEEVMSEHVKESDHGVEEEELFMFDRADTSKEDLGINLDCGSPRNWQENLDEGLKLTFEDHDPPLCPNCGCRYSAVDSIEEDAQKLCSECQKLTLPLTLTITPQSTATFVGDDSGTESIVKENESFENLEAGQTFDESQEVTSSSGSKSGQNDSQHFFNFSPEEDEHRQIDHSPSVSSIMPDTDAVRQQMQNSGEFSIMKMGESDGAGISLLLKNSRSCIIRPVIQRSNFSASSISFDDLSYVRGSTNSMRSSVGHGTSISASSSVDLGRFPRQSSSRKSDIENYRFDPFAKHQRSISSMSGNSSQAFQPSSLGTSTQDLYEPPVSHLGKDNDDVALLPSQELLMMSEYSEVDDSKNHESILLGENSAALYENVEDLKSNSWDGEASATSPITTVDILDVAEDPCQSSLDAISEIEIDNISQHFADAVSLNSKSSIDEPMEPPVLCVSDDVAKECDTSDHAVSIVGESTVMVRSEEGSKARSLTLDEAMDTILFCRSIAHNLAYEAATIAINKENPAPSEASWELIPATGKSDADPDRSSSDPHSKNAGKSSSKSLKARSKKVETESKPTSGTGIGTEMFDEMSDLPSTTRLVGVPANGESMKPPKLESKCNCTIM